VRARPTNASLGHSSCVSETMQALTDARNSVTELMAGIHRVEVSLIPSVTRREAVANAIVHRDYSAFGPTRVQSR
jgi:ATP-dependent DNA helicase RecG